MHYFLLIDYNKLEWLNFEKMTEELDKQIKIQVTGNEVEKEEK